MNKGIIIISIVFFIVFIDMGISIKVKIDQLKGVNEQLRSINLDLGQKIKAKELMPKQKPRSLSWEYGFVLNQIRLLERYSGTTMNVVLDGTIGMEDVQGHYEETAYKGIKGLKIKIVVGKLSQGADMGVVLDDIHFLEKNTDLLVSEIIKDNDNLTVKGEVYGF